jgi:hypothetical protein
MFYFEIRVGNEIVESEIWVKEDAFNKAAILARKKEYKGKTLEVFKTEKAIEDDRSDAGFEF